MSHFALLMGMLLPWFTGSIFLFSIRKHLDLRTSALLGYGFFLGAAILYLVLLAWQATTGAAGFWPVALTLLALSGAGLLPSRVLAKPRPYAHSDDNNTQHLRADWLVVALLALIGCHFALIAVELFYRPVFPWDAWQTWMYQAKVWFYSGGPVALDSPEEWIRGSGSNTYNMQGNHYPGLVSAQSYWAATAFGDWSETRVNWPTFFCGLALCLALWGQARAAGANPRISAAACFMLISLPLVGTHLSLAGYADIWLAGFSGLGLIAILRALLNPHPGQLALGFGFMALGLLTKHDAVVWLACGIALYCLVQHLRASLIIVAACSFVATIMALAGVTLITIPGAGQFGVDSGTLLLGPLGTWPLAPNNVTPAYLKHLYTLGSWNLLWYFTPAIIVAIFTSSHLRSLRAPIGWLFFLLIASQAVIFGLTAAGAWATDGTAANRLLLHVAPVIVFWMVVTVTRLLPVDDGRSNVESLRRPALAAVLATVFVGAGVHLWTHTEAESIEPKVRNFNGQELRAVMGSASLVEGEAQITKYQSGAAILTTGRTQLNAQHYHLLSVHANPENRKLRTFFWRRTQDPQNLLAVALSASDTKVDLRNEPDWMGMISEVGFVFREDNGRKAGLSQLTLQSATPAKLWSLATHQWLQSERWSQRSANGLLGGADEPLIPLPILVGCWLLVSVLILAMINRKRGQRVTTFAAFALFAWLVVDARWLHNSWGQALATRDHYRHAELPDALDMGEDESVVRMAQVIVQHLGEAPVRVAIGMASEGMRFEMRRAKYAMLPHAGHVHDDELGSWKTEYADAAVVLYPRTQRERDLPKKIKGRSGWIYPTIRLPMGALYVAPSHNDEHPDG
ncbi:hypothetical protein Q6D67_05280 [Haliea sp. E1-2-M8]|uniref:hypothetical protein n=1 Tax=Haliea sp. E1-2-M8 TaxID=3064706 RepID=UPI002716318A|nr:hypothetical protein [Haliea sp. E1-2-M8]MDO8861109.1 hypothetical protein [Haliea sp. E1-2-M8]